jgi:hypothetical protein
MSKQVMSLLLSNLTVLSCLVCLTSLSYMQVFVALVTLEVFTCDTEHGDCVIPQDTEFFRELNHLVVPKITD